MSGSSGSIYGLTAPLLDGRAVPFSAFRGQVLLIVNTASLCGLTPQYAGLEELFQRFSPRGLQVLAFPSNQFGAQEPGTAEEIGSFCRKNYDVTFLVFAKIDVNGTGTHPLYRLLKAEKPGIFWTEKIKWNFTKFLVSRSGQVVSRHSPSSVPAKLAPAIEKLLNEPA